MSAILGTSVTGAGGGAGAYSVSNSLRFRASASAYLNRTPAVAGNQKTWTYSAWVKKSAIIGSGNRMGLFGVGPQSAGAGNFCFAFSNTASGGADTLLIDRTGVSGPTSTAIYRDPSAWYHVVLAVNTTLASNRVKVYVNGVEITSWASSLDNIWAQNTDTLANSTNQHRIGQFYQNSEYLDGYLSNINFIDGQALTPSSFGETNASTGVWQPKAYAGTYGTNGFYLPFSNQSTATYAGSFNGSNQSLSVAQNAAFSFGTGDFTVEAWVFANSWNGVNPIIALGDGAVGGGSPVYSGWALRYDSSGVIVFYRFDGTETRYDGSVTLNTNQWNHIAVSKSGGTLRMFANGVQVFSGANALSYNNVNSNTLKIGGNWVIGGGVVTWVNGLISNARIVKGTGLYTGNFVPSKVPLTAVSGTSLLTLQNSSIVDNSTNAFSITNNNSVTTSVQNPFAPTGIAADQSGNANNWNTNNISLASGVTYDSMTDSPTPTSSTVGNFCVMNPVANFTGTLSNGNLTLVTTVPGNDRFCQASMKLPRTGKWYWENTISISTSSDARNAQYITNSEPNGTGTGTIYAGVNCHNATIFSSATVNSNLNAAINASGGGTVAFAYDADAGSLWMLKNGNINTGSTANVTGLSNSSGELAFMIKEGSGSVSGTNNVNFGQRPFAYTPPAGFNRLQTFNLPTPTIGASATTLANKYFDATLYTGTGSTLSVTNAGSFGPDLVWLKIRSASGNQYWFDTNRGVHNFLLSDGANAEANATNTLTAFNSNGFTLGTSNGTNPSGASMVAWQWRGSDSSAVTNTAGSITSTVSANPTAGFSVVTYTGNASASATVGHGLGVAPAMIIVKSRTDAADWTVGHQALGWNQYIILNRTLASQPDNAFNTAPTSTTFGLLAGYGIKDSGQNYVAYCFAEVAGYSKFGSYTGNGSTDGTFVYTGFRPRYVMLKRTNSTGSWIVQDTAMNPSNNSANYLLPNASDAQGTDSVFDILSNGFKIRNTFAAWNANGGTYIYMAFAENPFNYSLAR